MKLLSYDLRNRIYLDAVIQTVSEYQEARACIDMLERSSNEKAILITDRGYENYNIICLFVMCKKNNKQEKYRNILSVREIFRYFIFIVILT